MKRISVKNESYSNESNKDPGVRSVKMRAKFKLTLFLEECASKYITH